MPERTDAVTLSILGGMATEHRKRFVEKDAVIAEVLDRPVRQVGGEGASAPTNAWRLKPAS
jgi:hypothetical protein